MTAFLSGLIGSPAAEVAGRLAELIPMLAPDDDVALLALTAL